MNRRSVLKGFGGVVGVAAIASMFGGDDENSGAQANNSPNNDSTSTGQAKPQTEAEQDTQENQDEASAQTSVNLGEHVEDDSLSMVVRDVRTADELGEFQQAAEGKQFVVVRLAVKNTGTEFIAFNGFLQTRLKDSEDYNYDQAVAATGKNMNSGQLAPGEVERGDIVFEVPVHASGLTLQFDFETFDLFEFDRVVVNLEQEANSVANLDQDLDVDIHSPGDSVSYGDVSVTVNDVRVEERINSFATPEDGNEYIVVDITTENNTGEEQTISTILQMLLKDGTGSSYQEDLTATSQLDRAYDEGTPLAGGESRRGELAYEVEKGASPLYWAFEFTLWVDGDKTFWQLR